MPKTLNYAPSVHLLDNGYASKVAEVGTCGNGHGIVVLRYYCIQIFFIAIQNTAGSAAHALLSAKKGDKILALILVS